MRTFEKCVCYHIQSNSFIMRSQLLRANRQELVGSDIFYEQHFTVKAITVVESFMGIRNKSLSHYNEQWLYCRTMNYDLLFICLFMTFSPISFNIPADSKF
ncbi:hypothetical protein L798_13791 [Zootermopsis nevadensis]|uniref:Uncharacterized protein n=1 Tax=Zootermopsis nevadensis TaxID=136037 RepID=A0A067QZS1_ZOONE|nr:hypothetical protein L798_13791 [Zootermopsis nevadensis]